MKFGEIAPASISDAWSALESENYELLPELVIAVALHESDLTAATQLLLRAAQVPNPHVRGNAILGFGHLARRFRVLDRSSIEPLVAAGLGETNDYVRGQSHAAADDLNHFLGWQLASQPGA